MPVIELEGIIIMIIVPCTDNSEFNPCRIIIIVNFFEVVLCVRMHTANLFNTNLSMKMNNPLFSQGNP
jgi:hypothetical protein